MYQVCIRTILLSFVATLCFASEGITFKDGEHYDKVDVSILANDVVKQHIAQDVNKVQIVEFFSYGCYWCSQVHEPLSKWAASKTGVSLYHYPAIFNNVWRELAKVYLAVQELDNAVEIDQVIFKSIHKDNVRAWQENEVKKIIGANHGNVQVFEQYFNSFVIASKVNKAEILGKAYKIDATPYIIVHGPHASYVTSLSKTKDKETLIKVLDYLVAREQKYCQTATTQKS